MSASIVSRTITTADQRIVLANDQCGRRMAIGSTWNTLRIAMRVTINANGLTSNFAGTKIQVGVCSGTSAMIASPTTTNFIGVQSGTNNQNGSTWTRGALTGSGFYYASSASRAISRVGTTYAYSTTTNAHFPYLTETAGNKRWAWIMEITKGSPNWTIQVIYANGVGTLDMPFATLYAAFEAASMAGIVTNLGANYVSGGTPEPLAFSEAAGAIDTINIAWSQSTRPIEISDIIYARIA